MMCFLKFYGIWLNIIWLMLVNGAVVDLSTLKSYIVNQHNSYRKSEYASNMIKLTWDEALSRESSYWVEKCRFEHKGSGLGENLYFDDYKKSVKDFVTDALNSWYEERRHWQVSKGNCGLACHYTQMVWANTTTVGCGIKKCPVMNDNGRTIKDTTLFACFYYPKGNMYGSYPFTIGPICSKCPKNSHCENQMCVRQFAIQNSTHPVVRRTSLQPTTTTMKTTTVDSTCVDRLRGCEHWKADCASNHAVRISCPKTCDRCNPPAFLVVSPPTVACEDETKFQRSCNYWASLGYCSKNQLMREVYCQKTCKTCK
ncbi:hypothetical protein LOTGIDRAFT_233202 [Lottia gigantea]|uniref:ShKT domain-containing protein n=1 Tax=Lottia gigantea TaxID=225164 RepID=V4A6X1_LOTGI|nr:hypothetical protein LOTGIDRAFT_233202 [Lottia gigantea]ESO92462.1 hypothetical protein LOTGIDRAFT_233202 [Lottia gigantea]